MKYTFPMIFKQEKEGGYSVYTYDLKGVNTQGETIGDALSVFYKKH